MTHKRTSDTVYWYLYVTAIGAGMLYTGENVEKLLVL